MTDEKLIRLENLKRELKGVPERDRARYLMDRLSNTIGYWSGLLGGKRTFGEKVARRIEEGLGWPRGCLDEAGPGLSADEAALLAAFRSLPADGSPARERAIAYVLGLAAAHQTPAPTPEEAITEARGVIRARTSATVKKGP